MPPTLQALAALLVLLPGFLAAYILQALCVRRRQTELDKIVEALIFSFLIYFVSVRRHPHRARLIDPSAALLKSE
jgi:uncharacterized membrane protein YjjB (DUF3815 family)